MNDVTSVVSASGVKDFSRNSRLAALKMTVAGIAPLHVGSIVITSYSIHYTKLYDFEIVEDHRLALILRQLRKSLCQL